MDLWDIQLCTFHHTGWPYSSICPYSLPYGFPFPENMELYTHIRLDSGQKNDESLSNLPTDFFIFL